jgi:hypothetical protein
MDPVSPSSSGSPKLTDVERLVEARVRVNNRTASAGYGPQGRFGQVEFLLPNGNIYGVRPAAPFEIRLWNALVRQFDMAARAAHSEAVMEQSREAALQQVNRQQDLIRSLESELRAAREVINSDRLARIAWPRETQIPEVEE